MTGPFGKPRRESSKVDSLDASANELRIIERQLLIECVSMIKYASASGLSLPPSAVEIVSSFQEPDSGSPMPSDATAGIDRLVMAHARLARTIAPATPRSVR